MHEVDQLPGSGSESEAETRSSPITTDRLIRPSEVPEELDSTSPEHADTDGALAGVVGIGASAGGLESLERFFAQVPNHTGLAFVVVQHLSPDFKSLIDELLARRTALPICQAENQMAVEPDTVYLLPPRKEMIIRGGKLLLSDKAERQGLSLPIDHFFRSLAEDVGSKAAAIVLSGTGSDGSRGLLDVKRAGGIVLVESESSAQFDGMPIAAQRTGVVDHVLRPEEMPEVLSRALGLQDQQEEVELEASADEVSEHALQTVLRLLRDDCSIDFSHYKMGTVRRRVDRRRALLRLDTLAEYADRLRQDAHELNSLYEDLLIGVTRFFRDKRAFAALESTVIPELISRNLPQGYLRVWVPGCATGEEAYSIAILLHEQITRLELPLSVKVFATDAHRRSLEIASAGVYAAEALAEVEPTRLQRYFAKVPSGYQVSQDLRQMIVFAPHNMLRDAPFTKLDLISCRNVLIYFQPHAQRAALSLFHFGLNIGGVLFLGSSESTGGLSAEFETIDEHWRLYRKIREMRPAPDMRLSLLRSGAQQLATIAPTGRSAKPGANLLATYDRLLDRFMPPSCLVDAERQLVDTFGGAERFLRVTPRRPSNGFIEQLPESARAVIAGLIQRALRGGGAVHYEGLNLLCDGKLECVDVVVEPLEIGRPPVRQLLVQLHPHKQPERASSVPLDGAGVGHGELLGERVQSLEDELAHSRENLQASVEELEASNEELQATNEELVASNEELQSTNEELHSVNEELYSVNAEFQKKIFELEELNSDFKHLLEGTDVGILFLDAELNIRKFTPRIGQVFGLLPHDVGRKISVFSPTFHQPSLIADCERALKHGAICEERVQDSSGAWLFLRILPYRFRSTQNDDVVQKPKKEEPPPVQGVVMTLTDITSLEHAREKLDLLSAIVESSDDAITAKSLDGTLTAWNGGAERLYGYRASEAIGHSVFMMVPEEKRAEEQDFLARIARDERIDHVETVRLHKDGRRIHVSVTMSAIKDGQGRVCGISAIARDVTQLVTARRQLDERQERIRLLLESMAEGVYGIDRDGRCTFINPSGAHMLGRADHEQLTGQVMHALIPHTGRDGEPCNPTSCPLHAAMTSEGEVHSDAIVLTRADGTTFPAECWSRPLRIEGRSVGAVVTFVDIAERKRTEEEILSASRRREEFLAMLSHELRNPLAAVLSATKVLGLPSVEGATVERARQVVQRQSMHMARLLDDLLDVARITRGSIGLKRKLVDLRDCAQTAVEALKPMFESHGTTLEARFPDHPVFVDGDPDRLQQVHANLLGNASVYSPNGSHVVLEMTVENGSAVCRVKDNGHGMSPELLPHVFELFVQGQQRLDRPRGGLGIGLTLVQTIVRMHGGSIEARSEGEGKGSEFIVRLPLGEDPSVVPAIAPPKRAGKPRVLLIEDNEDARDLLKTLLETAGYPVTEACDCATGLAGLEAAKPDVAIIDIGLPGVDGYEIAREIRRREEHRHAYLIALTGYGQDSDVAQAREAGFDQHLTKPVDIEVLTRLLAKR